MAQDFTALSTTELYTALLTHISDRDADLALCLDPATTACRGTYSAATYTLHAIQ
jgi:hypothetical protein